MIDHGKVLTTFGRVPPLFQDKSTLEKNKPFKLFFTFRKKKNCVHDFCQLLKNNMITAFKMSLLSDRKSYNQVVVCHFFHYQKSNQKR